MKSIPSSSFRLTTRNFATVFLTTILSWLMAFAPTKTLAQYAPAYQGPGATCKNVKVAYRSYESQRQKVGFDTFTTTTPPRKYLNKDVYDTAYSVVYTNTITTASGGSGNGAGASYAPGKKSSTGGNYAYTLTNQTQITGWVRFQLDDEDDEVVYLTCEAPSLAYGGGDGNAGWTARIIVTNTGAPCSHDFINSLLKNDFSLKLFSVSKV